MSMFFKNPCHQNVSTDIDFAQIDHKGTSVFSPKRHFLKKYLVNPGFNERYDFLRNVGAVFTKLDPMPHNLFLISLRVSVLQGTVSREAESHRRSRRSCPAELLSCSMCQ